MDETFSRKKKVLIVLCFCKCVWNPARYVTHLPSSLVLIKMDRTIPRRNFTPLILHPLVGICIFYPPNGDAWHIGPVVLLIHYLDQETNMTLSKSPYLSDLFFSFQMFYPTKVRSISSRGPIVFIPLRVRAKPYS